MCNALLMVPVLLVIGPIGFGKTCLDERQIAVARHALSVIPKTDQTE
jgi:hypothetical protein